MHHSLCRLFIHISKSPHAHAYPVKWELIFATVCPKVACNSFHMVFSAISEWILKPFDLQVATMCGFDIMYDKPELPSQVPQCKWITFRHDLEEIIFSGNPTSTVWRFRRPW